MDKVKEYPILYVKTQKCDSKEVVLIRWELHLICKVICIEEFVIYYYASAEKQEDQCTCWHM